MFFLIDCKKFVFYDRKSLNFQHFRLGDAQEKEIHQLVATLLADIVFDLPGMGM